MSNPIETYSTVANAQNKFTQAVVKFTKDFFPFLILILNILLSLGSKLFKTWLENPFTPDFFISLGTNILATMFCYICFIKYGEDNEKMCSDTYRINVNKWSEMSGIVRSKYSDKFIEYCKRLVDEERDERRHSYIANYTMISVETYEKEYKHKSKAEIKRLVEEGKLSPNEAKYINKANATHKVKPINPILILCGVQTKNINDVGRTGLSNSVVSILSRPLSTFVITACLTMFNGTWVGIGDASAVFDMIYSVLMIVVASFAGYSSGATTAKQTHDKIKGRIYFLERFLNNKKEGD